MAQTGGPVAWKRFAVLSGPEPPSPLPPEPSQGSADERLLLQQRPLRGTEETSLTDKAPSAPERHTASSLKDRSLSKRSAAYLSPVVGGVGRFMMTLRYDNLKYVLHCF